MTLPTFVAEYESSWTDTGTTRTVSVTRDNGDRLVALATTSDNSATLATPTLSGVTWTLATSRGGANNTWVYVWTGTATTSTTSDLSITRSGTTQLYGVNVFRFTASDGFGNAASGGSDNGAPSQALTTTQADSTICCISSDWNALDGTSRTARTVSGATYTERTYTRNASYATVYAGTWEGVGAAGSKTVGWSAPSGQDYSIAAVEILGSSSGGDQTTNADATAIALAGQTSTAAGSGTASVASDAAAVALSGQTPTLAGTGAVSVAADTAVLSLAGQDVSATSGDSIISSDVAVLVLTGQAPTIAGTGAATITADTAALTLTGQTTTASGTDAASLTVDPATVVLTGQTPSASSEGGPVTIPVDPAVLALSGQTPDATGTGASTVTADPGVLALTGQTPGTEAHTVIPVDTAALMLAGLTATAIGTGGAPVAADPAAVTLAGQTPSPTGTGTGQTSAGTAALSLSGVLPTVFSGAIPASVQHLGTHREAGNLGTYRPGHIGTHRESATLGP